MKGLAAIALSAFAVVASVSRGVDAWGAVGHKITGTITEYYLTSRAKSVIKSILGTTTLSDATTYADDVKSTAAYKWSAELHYVNAADNPPTTCNYVDSRDCASGKCVTGAIRNYTTILSTASNYGSKDTSDALKFLIHFIGDIHQPLHICGRDSGGNGATVKFFGSSTNLHSLWDTGIITRRIKDAGSQDAYIANIINLIEYTYAKEASSWITCSDGNRYHSCPAQWATVNNNLNCNNVYKGYYSGIELGQEYYDLNKNVIDKQLAITSYRMAAILNAVL